MNSVPPGSRQSGVSYVEALIAVVILGLALVPAMETLQIALTGSDVQTDALRWQHQAATRIEDVLAEPFSALEDAAQVAGNETTPSSYSDAPGTPDRTVVFLSRYDADNADADNDPFTGTDDGIVWVRVEIEGTVHVLTTLRAE